MNTKLTCSRGIFCSRQGGGRATLDLCELCHRCLLAEEEDETQEGACSQDRVGGRWLHAPLTDTPLNRDLKHPCP